MVKRSFYYLLFFFVLMVGFIPIVFASNLKISSVELVEKSTNTEIDTINYSNNVINSNITFNGLDDYYILDIEFDNDESKEYELVSIIDNNDNLSVNYDANNKILSNSKSKIRVIVKNDKDLVNQDKLVINDYALTFNFTYNVVENPFTKDNIMIAIIFLILSIIVFIILYKSKLKNYWVLIFCFISVPIIVYASSSVSIKLSFNNNTIKGRFLSYVITLDDNNGNTSTVNRTFGDNLGSLDVPNINGYNFDGWFNDDDEEIGADFIVEDEMNLTAHYSPINYTINYNLDDGSLPSGSKTSYTIEDEYTLPTPEKLGYNFDGWSEGDSTTVNPSVTISSGTTGNKSYTAHYSPRNDTSYTVNHVRMDLNGEYTITETVTGTGTTNTSVTPPVKSYEGFSSPSAGQVLIKGDGTGSITYQYERKKVYLYLYDEEYIDSETLSGEYYYGTEITLKAKDRDGYEFDYWYNGGSDPTLTVTLTDDYYYFEPYYNALEFGYTVYYYLQQLNGQYILDDTYHGTAYMDDEIYADMNDYTGFDYPDYEYITITSNPDNNVVSYYYDRHMYTLNIGNTDFVQTTTPSGEYPYETEITLTAKDVPGWEFYSWSNYEYDKTITFIMDQDYDIEPYYDEKWYSISLDPTYGSVDEWYLDIRDGQPMGEIPQAYGYDGYKFVGWYTDSDGGTLVDENYYPSDDITIYAHWEELQEFTITLNGNGGTVDPNELTVTELQPIGYLPIAHRDNYVMSGWYTGITDGVKVDDSTIVTGNMNLYARWVYSVQTASIPDSITVKINETESINITNSNELETFSFAANDEKTATVDSNGVVKGISVGTTSVRAVGLLSGQTKDIQVYVITDDTDTYTITFDPNEGQVSETTRQVYDGMSIGDLPMPTKDDNSFGGWVDEDTGDIYVATTVPTKDVTLTAEWNVEDYVARIEDTYYTTLQAAFDAADYQSEIFLLKDIVENTIHNNYEVILNLDGHKIYGSLENHSTLTILNGEIEYYETVINNTSNLIIGSEDSAIDDGVIIRCVTESNVDEDFDPDYEYADFPYSYAIYNPDYYNDNGYYNSVTPHVNMNKGSIISVGKGSYISATGIEGGYIYVNGGNIIPIITDNTSGSATGIYVYNESVNLYGGSILPVSPGRAIGVSSSLGSVAIYDGLIRIVNASEAEGIYSFTSSVNSYGGTIEIDNCDSAYGIKGKTVSIDNITINISNLSGFGSGVDSERGASVKNSNISISNTTSSTAILNSYNSTTFTDNNVSFTNVGNATGLYGAGTISRNSVTFDDVDSGTGYNGSSSSSSSTSSVVNLDVTANNSGSITGIFYRPSSSFSVTGGSFIVNNSSSATGIDVSAGSSDYVTVTVTGWNADIHVSGKAYAIDLTFTDDATFNGNNINVVSTGGSADGILVMHGRATLNSGTLNVTGGTYATGVTGGSGPYGFILGISEIKVTSNERAIGAVGKSISITNSNISIKVKGNNSSNTVGFYWGSDGGAQVSVPSGKTLRSRTISGGYTEFYAG